MQFCLFGAPQAEGGASGVAASLQQNTNSSVALYSGTVVAKRSDDVGLDVNFFTQEATGWTSGLRASPRGISISSFRIRVIKGYAYHNRKTKREKMFAGKP